MDVPGDSRSILITSVLGFELGNPQPQPAVFNRVGSRSLELVSVGSYVSRSPT